jgi:predicted permease
VTVVSHAFWKRQLGGDPAAVGTVVRIGGRPFEIVGVAARAFEGTILQIPRLTEIWVPLSSTTLFAHLWSASPQTGADPRVLSAIGRLADARDVGRASAEMASVSKHFDDTAPISRRTGEGEPMRVVRSWNVTTVDAAYARAADFGRFGTILLLLVAMVLIVACTNLANLTLARGAARQHEQSVRRALGASRWRLVREHSMESGIVAVLGGLGAFAVTRLILTGLPEMPLAQGFSLPIDASPSGAAVAVSAAAVLLSLTVFGIGPALQLTRGSVRADLAHGSGGVGPAPTPSSRRSIRWQVAIATTFFIVATASMKAGIMQARQDPGIDLDRIAIGHIDFHLQRWDEARARRAIDAVLEQGRRQPGLETIAVSSGMPFGTTMTPYFSLARPGEAFKGRGDAGAVTLAASPEIFRALGIDLLQGRTFDQRDTAASQPVVVMGARAALDVFGTTQVVGREVQLSRLRMLVPGTSGPAPELTRIIGIVSDADTTHLSIRSGGIIYRPLAQQYEPTLTIVGRAKGNPRAAVDAIRAAVRSADPELSVNRAGTGFMMLAGVYVAMRLAAVLAGGLGLLALLLSMAGLHGVLAQMVSMRTREVGLRIALGAETRAITRMVLGDGFRPIIQGLMFGLLLGVLGRFVLRATTAPDLSVFDPVGLVIIPIPVLLAGFLACYAPARRAAQVDPNVALKAL